MYVNFTEDRKALGYAVRKDSNCGYRFNGCIN